MNKEAKLALMWIIDEITALLCYQPEIPQERKRKLLDAFEFFRDKLTEEQSHPSFDDDSKTLEPLMKDPYISGMKAALQAIYKDAEQGTAGDAAIAVQKAIEKASNQ